MGTIAYKKVGRGEMEVGEQTMLYNSTHPYKEGKHESGVLQLCDRKRKGKQ